MATQYVGFENGIDAAIKGGKGTGWWFFKGSRTVKVEGGGIEKGPEDITSDNAWPMLRDTVFAEGIDAATKGGNGTGWWFFKGDAAVKVEGDVTKGPMEITAADAWPMLKGTVFAEGIDAAVKGGNDTGWWFFKGDMAVKVEGKRITDGPMEITAADAWPMLKGTVFAEGIDAAVKGGN
ncbi:hypothetical protein, partial [Streptomyces sp. NPDC055107]